MASRIISSHPDNRFVFTLSQSPFRRKREIFPTICGSLSYVQSTPPAFKCVRSSRLFSLATGLFRRPDPSHASAGGGLASHATNGPLFTNPPFLSSPPQTPIQKICFVLSVLRCPPSKSTLLTEDDDRPTFLPLHALRSGPNCKGMLSPRPRSSLALRHIILHRCNLRKKSRHEDDDSESVAHQTEMGGGQKQIHTRTRTHFASRGHFFCFEQQTAQYLVLLSA